MNGKIYILALTLYSNMADMLKDGLIRPDYIDDRVRGGFIDKEFLKKAVIYTLAIGCAYVGQEAAHEIYCKILNASMELESGLVRTTPGFSDIHADIYARIAGALAGGAGGFMAARKIIK